MKKRTIKVEKKIGRKKPKLAEMDSEADSNTSEELLNETKNSVSFLDVDDDEEDESDKEVDNLFFGTDFH